MRYSDYIHSKQWIERRVAKLEQAKYRCEYCGEREGLSVHHLTYERLGNERSDDLAVLCRSCHWVADEIRKTGNRELLGKWQRGQEKSEQQNRREERQRVKLSAEWAYHERLKRQKRRVNWGLDKRSKNK